MSTQSTPSHVNRVEHLPQFKVILENDDVNTGDVVIERVIEFARLDRKEASQRVMEAHEKGRSLLLVCHKERAELIQDQFSSCSPPITVVLEADQ